ncbi:MAG: PAS domain S-box protein [Desulfobacteraceae bacterium]|nr:PAS domain S-box protein [Candidatus Aminicenantes bacterium]MBL7176818.1 PAS domain S-box protein [Desulfobacteraceae bacterium]
MAQKPTYEELKQSIKELKKASRKHTKDEEKIRRFNFVLRTIRNVNQLLVKENDRSRLLQGICNNLIENRGYYNAWIVALDASGDLVTTAEAGLGKEFRKIIKRIEMGELTQFAQQALKKSKVVLTKDPFSTCTNCPLSTKYAGRGGMTVRLEHGGKVYGLLFVSLPREFIADKEEQNLLKEVAGDIAFGLHRIELEEEREHSEKALRESDKRLSQIVQGSSVPTFVINNKHIITHWNRACENLTGLRSNEIVGTQKQALAFYSIERPAMADLIVDNAPEEEISKYYGGKFRESNVTNGGYEAEDFFPNIGKEGKWLFFTAAPLKDNEGKVTGAIETLQDITERKQAEARVQESMHELSERVKELNCLYAISRLGLRRRLTLEQILQGIVDLIPHAWQYPEITCARMILEGKEFKTDKFEKTKWKLSNDIIVHGKPSGIFEVCYQEERPKRDRGPFQKEEMDLLNAIAERTGRIIERKRAEGALRESEQRFRDLIENSLTGISIVQDNQIIYQNPEQERLLGPLPRPFILADLGGIHPDDVDKVKQFYNKLSSGEVRTLDTDFRFYPVGKNGNRLDMKWVYCRTNLIDYQQKEAILVNMIDVTHAKELEDVLRIQDKMSSLGRVTAGIAHEIRNPLSGINVYLNTLEKIYDREDSLGKVKQILGQLQSASNKIESIIRRVMDFSKPSAPKFILADINKPIEEAITLSAVTLRKSGIKIDKVLAEDLPPCHSDPTLIEQIILNLITNASEAMKTVDGEKKIGVASSLENNRIFLRISDSGPGVPANIKDKIFDPFYTTKSDNTGIGLSLCQRIITDHGGSLGVSSSKWGGAEFVIEIPVEKEKV